MKRTIAIFLAALMLTGVLTACGASMGMDIGRGNGNVSTTDDGTVNGGAAGGMGNMGRANGTNRSSGMNGAGGMTGGYSAGSGSNSGTGMTGGR